MRVFRSPCKRGKIIPLWGTSALRLQKGKPKIKEKGGKTETLKMKIERKSNIQNHKHKGDCKNEIRSDF